MKKKTNVVVTSKVREAYIAKHRETLPSGVKAGRKFRGFVTAGAATVATGAAVAVANVQGFVKGLFS